MYTHALSTLLRFYTITSRLYTSQTFAQVIEAFSPPYPHSLTYAKHVDKHSTELVFFIFKFINMLDFL